MTWLNLRLSDACQLVTDGTHHSPPNGQSGPFLYVTAKNIRPWGLDISDITYVSADVHREIYARCPVEQGDVLYIKDGVTTGLAAVNHLERPFSLLSSVALLKPRRDLLDPHFLKHWLNSPETVALMTGNMNGSAIRRLVLKQIREAEILLPPLVHQRLIVSKVESLTARSRRAKEALDAVPALLEQFRQSVLAAAFRGDLTAAWREKNPDVEPAEVLLQRIRTERRRRWEEAELAKMRAKGKVPGDDRWKEKYEEPEPVDASELPELPEGWAWVRLPECGSLERGRSRHRPRNDPALFGGSYPFIQTGDVAQSGGTISKYSQTYNETGLTQSKLFRAGTVCITIAANIANSGVLNIDACFPDSVVGVTVDRSIVSPEYLEFYVRHVRADISAFAPGTAQKNINLEILGDVAIPIPPASERVAIERRLQELFSLAERHLLTAKQSLLELNSLDRAILSKAFRGELVPQDPTDEPASVLLERLRTEAAEPTGKKPKGGKRRGAEGRNGGAASVE
ncbi:restriction endonuclease subunit S [Polyangium sp. 15x6]|uniref:restriction endonuclease subunit S n=1 Tax=Polyangium sp. 15x6 TaxID=3042687 RepID=UPI00249BD0C6|nr:restriction endonuclease subunit S [Polyangium sp. 15x6]MDI3290684.1 restriction endonuclease subunit S [Polyangium sp. 15x6]